MARDTAVRKGPEPSGQELVLTRVIDAPQEAVFKAWTDQRQMARWFGPKGFTLPFCEIDLRVGGVVHYCMRSPEGRDYWGKSVYREIVEPERLVLTDVFSDEKGNTVQPVDYGMSADWPVETTVTVTFDDLDGKTGLTVRQSVSESLAESSGARQGWAETLDKLAEYLSKS
ncbi:MAG: hypothetical protein A2052_09515 [Deltaproteobacteria bacterium GWA2_54_12]|nr:MAG: hypothetical protein A2052_09515 [Deltaproteobacteria bacterium GWA2_54_12]